MRKRYPLLLAALASCGAPEKPTVQAPPLKPVFDVPALLGKNMDQIQKALRKPGEKIDEPSALQMRLEVPEWENQFQRDTTMLMVTYNPKTRKVIDFFVSTNHGKMAEVETLLQLANVKPEQAGLSIEPVQMVANKELFTGVKLVVK